MITVLVGHRGTGKTGLLRRIRRYRPTAAVHDLDETIEAGEGTGIDEIFRARGEDAFRKLERDALARLVETSGDAETFVALGAGFTGPLPHGVHCLWVRRDTDRDGRIFLDRPRLDPDLDPLEEYRRRFGPREARYREWADDVLTLGEGFEDGEPGETRFFRGPPAPAGGIITLLPEHVRQNAAGRTRLADWAKRRRGQGIAGFELRDDLLSGGQLRAALESLRIEDLLYSFRKPQPVRPEPWPAGLRFDWDVNLGRCPHGVPAIVSLHTREADETIAQAGRRLEAAAGPGVWLKLAVEVRSFPELLDGHHWAMADPTRRAFLPCSEDGRWAWYRIAHGGRFPIVFVREGAGSAPDQPTLTQWLRRRDPADRFAAVLGDPVRHSRSPAEHHGFFDRRGLNMVAVRITEGDWEAGALGVLETLGLRYAAVTAPHKRNALAAAGKTTPAAKELNAVNTLLHDESTGRWCGTNTDLDGLRAALAGLDLDGPVAIWGGGGMRPGLERLFPDAAGHAARTGRPTTERRVKQPRTVVWASGRPGARPPAAWRPDLVIDLDYREDAPGRAYALDVRARYVGGLAMFREQARRQRAWWESQPESVSWEEDG